MFFLGIMAFMAMALAAQASENILTVPPHRLVARVTTLTSPTGPQQTGTISACNKWYNIASGDSCASVETAFGITHAQFLLWNPAVSADCSQNFWLGYTYCVGVSSGSVSSTTTTSASSATGAQSTPGAPTMSGIPCNCNKYYIVVSGDSCPTVEAQFGITHAQFLAWNPTVSSDCATNFWTGEAYCVGVNTAVTACPTTTSTSSGGSTGSSTTSSISRTSNTEPYSVITGDVSATVGPRPTASDWPPSPTGAGTITSCIRYYQANPGDTCQGIVNHYSNLLSMGDFLSYNPAAGTDATSCALYVNYYYCIDAPTNGTAGGDQPTATTTIFPPWSPTVLPSLNTTSEIPQPTAAGAPANCQSWYQAADGDTCASVASSLGYLAASDIQSWNSGISCSSPLVADEYYCVASYPSGGALPMPSTVGTAPSPTQAGIISSCKGWYLATQGDSCDLVPQVFGTFDESSFLSWNPALGGSGCSGLVIGDYYCIAVPGTPTTRTSLPSSSPTQTNGAGPQPEQPGIPADCSSYWLVSSTDNCTTIAAANGITEQQLNSWNPSLGGVDCPNLLPDYYVCVKAGSAGTSVPATGTTTRTSTTTHASTTTTTTTTTTTGTSTTSPPLTTPTPIQPNMSPTCNRFYLVQPGDGCFAIAASANIPLATFYALNPSVGSDCANLLSGFYVCLGAASDGSGAPATTISTGAPVAATPSPVQSGMVAGCRRFYLVEGGDSCFGIASAAGVDLSLFGTWNPAVGASSGCGGLLSGEFVCIGVSGGGGSATTITSGGAVPAATG